MPAQFIEATILTPRLLCCEFRDTTSAITKPERLSAPPAVNTAERVYGVTAFADNAGAVRITLSASPGITSPFIKFGENENLRLTLGGLTGLAADFNDALQVVSVVGQPTQYDIVQSVFPAGYTYPGGAVAVPSNQALPDAFLPGTDPTTGQSSHWYWTGRTFIKKWMRKPIAAADRLPLTGWQFPGNAYAAIGGQAVTSVTAQKDAYDSFTVRHVDGSIGAEAQMRMLIHIELAGDLAEGSHTIAFPAASGLGNIPFVYDKKKTRHKAIQTPFSYRPGASLKNAYLTHWAHGHNVAQNGNVDFTAIAAQGFEIINEFGSVEFSGPIVLRKARAAADALYRQDARHAGRAMHPAGPKKPLNIVSIARGATTTVTYSLQAGGVDPANGDFVYFHHVRGVSRVLTAWNGYPWRVSSVNTGAKTFVVQSPDDTSLLNSTSYSDYQAGTGEIRFGEVTNQAGVDVWELDASGYVPPLSGRRWLKTSVGVSDAIEFDASAHYAEAKKYFGGMFHQLHFVNFDGRYGFTSGASFGATKKVYKSLMTAMLNQEGQSSGLSLADFNALYGHSVSVFSMRLGANATWRRSATPLTGVKFGVGDAGDPDNFYYHMNEMWRLCHLYQVLPSASRNVSFNAPTLVSMIDASLAGTDAMPDILKPAFYVINGFRLLQEGDGMIVGGLQMDTQDGDPQPEWGGPMYFYHPDLLSTKTYAAAAFKLAHALDLAGFATWATTFRNSAILADDAAEALYTNQAAHRTYMLTPLGPTGWTAQQKSDFADYVQLRARPARARAAAARFLSTGNATAKALVEAEYAANQLGNPEGTGAQPLLDYITAAGNTPATALAMSSGLTNWMTTNYLPPVQSVGSSFRACRYSPVGGGGGFDIYGNSGGGVDMGGLGYAELIFGHQSTGDVKYLNALQAQLNKVHGANAEGTSMASGVGPRDVKGCLHDNMLKEGVYYPGVSIYGWAPMSVPNQDMFSFDNRGAPCMYDPDVQTYPVLTSLGSDYVQFDPPAFHWPIVQHNFKGKNSAIGMMENTLGETFVSAVELSVYLWAIGGNAATVKHGGKVRALCRG